MNFELFLFVSSLPYNTKKELADRQSDGNRLSVEFVTNRNGSMVNMRCADGTSPTPTADTKRRDASGSWMAGRPRPSAVPRPSMARIAPAKSTIGPGLLQGRRPEKRTAATDVHVDWPNGPLYSAMRICKMDDTVDDWNRLLDHSKL